MAKDAQPTEKRSLREIKKARSHAHIQSVARQLFEDRGYNETMLEDVAEAAEVSVPTVLAYFGSKERLALAGGYETLESFEARVDDPERDESTLSLWRRHVERGATRLMDDPEAHLRYIRMVESTPTLARGTLHILQQYEAAIARGLGRDFGVDPYVDLPCRLLATVLSYSNHTVVTHWLDAGGKGDLRADALSVIDFVISTYPMPSAPSRRRRAATRR